MVRSIGIDPGDRVVNVVELDGSYRKTRLVNVSSSSLGAGDDPMRPDLVADAVREAIDDGMKGDVTLGHPCREAVLRTIELPFKGAEAIKKVVKAEIEGEIFTHSVDDMVVDFHEIGPGTSGGTKLLVASVPKLALRNQLTSLSAQSIEPAQVDLDTMALWRAADWVGAFDLDEDADDDDSGSDDKPVHAVVDLGARSVKVILTEGDQLVEMRVLRLGDGVVGDHVARAHGIGAEQARLAAEESLRTGGDVSVDVGTLADAGVGGDGEFVVDAGAEDGDSGESAKADDVAPGAVTPGAVVPAAGVPAVGARPDLVTHSEVEAAHTKYLQRLARELTRFLAASGMAARIRSVWMSGSASRSSGVAEMLEAVFGLAPQELDVLSHLSHGLDEEEAAELSPRMAIAVGLALGRFGGPEGFELRQEDLALTGGFDRIKFPLAIACMVGLLTLFVFANKKSMELKKLQLEIGQQHIDPARPKAAIFHGQLNALFSSKWFQNKRYFALKNKSGKTIYSYKQLVADVVKAPVHERVRLVRDKLRKVAAQKQKESGVYEEVTLESGLAVLVRWSEVMKSLEPQLGRYLVPSLDLDMKSRKLIFTCAFRGSDFRARMGVILRALELETGKPDSPFTKPERGTLRPPETLFQDRDEKGVTGAYYTFTLPIREVFPPFGPSARLGLLDPGERAAGRADGYLAAVAGEGLEKLARNLEGK